MLWSSEVRSSLETDPNVLEAFKRKHFARGWTIYLGGGDRKVSRAEIACSYCGGRLKLRKDVAKPSQPLWRLDGEPQTALSESCDERHEASEEWYRQTIRNLDAAMRRQRN